MKITIHQPEHAPWLGFFHKIGMADVYVVLDNVQYRKKYFQNRNRIRTEKGWQWITIPIKAENDTLIRDVKISYDHRWIGDYLNLIRQNYHKSKFYTIYMDELTEIIKKKYEYLAELNIEIIKYFLFKLGMKNKFIFASELNLPPIKGGTEVNLEICKALNAKIYISGISGKDYLNEEEFKKNNINVIYQEFHHPIYSQLYEPFIPCMSVIDLMFNYGEESLNLINGIDVPVIKELFL